MSFAQFFPIPVMVSLLAVTLMVLDSNKCVPYLLAWISFQAWAMYFLAGCTPKGGVKVVLGYLAGILASIAIMELAPVLGLYVAVFLVVVVVISAERVPWFDFVPSWFVGAGIFFAVMVLKQDWPAGATSLAKYQIATLHVMISCLVGQVYGVLTVLARGKYEAMLAAKRPA
jgi:hypothetical protein